MYELTEKILKESVKYFQNFFIHEYYKKSFLHFVDVRIKFLTALIFVMLAVTTFNFEKVLFLLFSILAIAKAAGIDIKNLIRRSYLFPAFSFIVLIPTNLSYAAIFSLRVFTAIIILQLLVITTPFNEICAALRYFKFPRSLVESMWISYRYILSLFFDLLTTLIARESRRVSKIGYLDVWKKGGKAVGTFFLKSIEKSEKVELAILARGKAVWKKDWKIKSNDLVFLAIVAFVVFWWWLI
ncbi:MAG: hypothetical protein NZ895_04365 [Archaeoglobaceae archaeon]|nr:hypothetical protein [Archaeoglobaceae archaeon]MCX8152575.1 hypothetical protein [Archaeoglobaceae archaeon]MDW8014143.1 CbiQ family ECF transporter T component [Archaeoglobaceae archaeon]